MATTKRAVVDPYQDSNELIPPSTYIPMVREWMELVREGYRLQTKAQPDQGKLNSKPQRENKWRMKP